ncbi:hypothetical protein Tco_0905967 [Tanacetum coccineum]
MHNKIMEAGSRDRPPMLATGRYAQWQSPVPATDNAPAVLERTTVETILNMSPENKSHYESEKEAIHLLLTGIGDEIYSTFDACKIAHEMWEDIERLQQDPYYQEPKFHKSSAPTSKPSPPTRSHVTNRHKGKEIAKPITPLSESTSEEDNDPEQAQKDKEMQKNLALINVDTTPRYKNDNQTGQFGNQRTMTVARAREIVQYDAGYNVFANERQHSEQPESISNTCVVEKVDSNVVLDSSNMCDNDIQTDQNDVECDDECVVLANLIANLKLNVDENKKIQKQVKKSNTALDHELTKCKSILTETSRTLGESNSIRDSFLVAL